MSENNERDAEKRHASTPNPAVEGESGQYVAGDNGEAGAVEAGSAAERSGEYAEGDYGEGGTVGAGSAAKPSGSYAEGDYGEAGMAGQTGTPADQSNDSPEDQDEA